ncbi:MAG: HlyC/CorC family transporter [Actinobacteria bacterium]|nr:HlyC/CorC family transporter [Actinomycetota bacterium]NIS34577.1 HlyC/CorC family transporter [Actinomycetota bacterium]NIT94181.1 HlyC/CorC family transporter [Actinomycetota bacterium]NIU21256.1 HlyC/CorC family transporter [Actinomycetota bacterium]NIU64266.1 HlyC/CorC family transporter [Actinomycetota bacterium]
MTAGFLTAAILLLVANGFFVAVEFALLASRTSRLEPMVERDDDPRASAALVAIRDLQPQLAGAQLGITMASLGLGYVAEPAVASLIESAIESVWHPPSGVLHTISFLVALTIVVVLHMVVGEMVPKNVAISRPEGTARILAPVHAAYLTLFRPVVWALNASSNGIVRLLGYEPVDELNTALTVNEFHTLLAGAAQEGKIEHMERELLAGALDFRARTAGSIMVPRERMVSVPRSHTVVEIEEVVASSGHSRIPVQGAGPADIIGFVHSKDLLRLSATDLVPLEMVRRMLIVDPDESVRDLMRGMRRQRRHMALVRTSDGVVLGMVTLEDVLEALVGDIRDETDTDTVVHEL